MHNFIHLRKRIIHMTILKIDIEMFCDKAFFSPLVTEISFVGAPGVFPHLEKLPYDLSC